MVDKLRYVSALSYGSRYLLSSGMTSIEKVVSGISCIKSSFLLSFSCRLLLADMRTISRAFYSLNPKLLFNKVDVKVDNKIGFIYLDSPKNFNALTV